MIVIVCLDHNNGMLFNARRQSQDRVLINDVVSTIGDKRLYIYEYSASLFSGYSSKYLVSKDPLNEAQDGDFCFIEDQHLVPYQSKIEKFVIYRWNRTYPADFIFDIDLSGYELISTTDFRGSSHEKITKEVFHK